jgi:antitoxin VapB
LDIGAGAGSRIKWSALSKRRTKTIMETATVSHDGECQTVRLPKGFHLSTPKVGVRHDGESIVLEPLKPKASPEGFFDSIHIADPAFVRPEQGQLPLG